MRRNCTTNQPYPPKTGESFTCVPPQASEGGATRLSAYLLAEPVGQLAGTAPGLVPSSAWGINHKPSSNLLMRGSPALLGEYQEISSSCTLDCHFPPSTASKCNYWANACTIDQAVSPTVA